MGHIWLASAGWMALALAASFLAAWTGITASLIEVFLGILAANTFGLTDTQWVDYLAGLGAIILAFLAGTELRVASLRQYAFASIAIGACAFVAPFLAVLVFSMLVMGWSWAQALIAGVALSTTSVALVYAVILEHDMSQTQAGQIVLSARFVNDLCTVLALGINGANIDYRFALFLAALLVSLWFIPRLAPSVLRLEKTKVSEPEIRFVGTVLFLLGGLASISGTEAVVPAYLVGISLAPLLEERPDLADRLRTVTFAWFAPFYFLRAGSFVDLSALMPVIGLAVILVAIKIASKCIVILPLARMSGIDRKESWSIALLMSTGLTFGMIAAYLGWTRGVIDQQQYALLVVSVIGSGTIPVLILGWIRKRMG